MNMQNIVSVTSLTATIVCSACGPGQADVSQQQAAVLSSPLPIVLKLKSIKMNGRSNNAPSPVHVSVTLPGLATTSTYIGDYSGQPAANPNVQFNCSTVDALPGSDGYCTTALPLNTTIGPTTFTGTYPANTDSAAASVQINDTSTNFTIDSQGTSSQTCATTWMFINGNIIDGDQITICWATAPIVPFIADPMVQTIFYPAPGEASQVGLQQMDSIATKTDWTYSDSASIGGAAQVNIKGAAAGSWDSQQSASFGLSVQSSSSFGTAVTLTSGSGTNALLSSTSMFPDPNDDLFAVLVGASATWTDFHDGSAPSLYIDMSSGSIEWLKLGWLQGLAQTPQVFSLEIPSGHVDNIRKYITPEVAQRLITQDPFASGQPIAATVAANPQRFVPASPARIALTRLISLGFQEVNATQTDTYTSESTGDSVSFSALLSLGASSSVTLTITHSNVNQSTASIQLQTKDPCDCVVNGRCVEGDVDLYMDTALGTIVPIPHLGDSCNAPTDTCTGGSVVQHVLLPGQSLVSGDTLTSCNGKWALTMQSDGMLVEHYLGDGTPFNTFWSPGGTVATMQSNGDFVVLDASGNMLADTGTSSGNGAFFILQDDGLLAIYDSLTTSGGDVAGALPALWTLGPGG